MIYYAHSNESEKETWQTLFDHLQRTAGIAQESAKFLRIEDYAYVAGLFHDIGKYSLAFQQRLEGSKKRVDHTTAGAVEIQKLLSSNHVEKIIARILAYCISGHHGGLLDAGSVIDTEEAGTLHARLKRNVNDYQDYCKEIDVTKIVFPKKIPIVPTSKDIGYSLSFFTRILYSLLVDADFLETEHYYRGARPRGDHEGISTLCERMGHILERFAHPEGVINEKRTETLHQCMAKAKQKPGFFTLTVPTGGGKTMSSMAFALNHAKVNGLRRVIYVIPYTSIIEQNAAEFKRWLGAENVLEHHSNFDWNWRYTSDETDNEYEESIDGFQKLRLAAENWDIPVVVTTNVQFFESLYANRSSRCRKIHNIAGSVIIFDEAQMLPQKYLKPCMYAAYELVKNYRSTVVFCTATQPNVAQFFPGKAEITELCDDPQMLYDFYKRVEIKKAGSLPDEELIQHIIEEVQALCIVNTRKHARGLYQRLPEDGSYHLSTYMCPQHRKETIATIRKRLADHQTCRVISTQIMEAGIDVDFPVGYRALAGIDSIIQAAGRVNREGKRPSAKLYVFEPDSEFVKRVPAYIQQSADIARSILREREDPICMEAVDAFFKQMNELHDQDKAFDVKGILENFRLIDLREMDFSFRTAAENFKMIENDTVPVVIPYDERARTILDEIRQSDFPGSYARKLQLYTVNIYPQEFRALENTGGIIPYADTYAVLNNWEDHYDPKTGLIIPSDDGGEGIFFDG